MTAMNKLEPIHPGEILKEDFLLPLQISEEQLARDTGIEVPMIEGILHGNRSISANIALRLSMYFGLSERFWLNLQSRYDLESEKDKVADRLKEEVRVLVTA
jgi:antitoxin HigA-1